MYVSDMISTSVMSADEELLKLPMPLHPKKRSAHWQSFMLIKSDRIWYRLKKLSEVSDTMVKVKKKPEHADRLRSQVEKKDTEISPPDTESKLRVLVTHAPMGIVVAQDGILKFANPKMVKISGYSPAELSSRPFVDFVHPDDRAMVLEYHRKRLDGKDVPETYVIRMISNKGTVKYLENSGVAIDWEGRTATLNFLVDISERMQSEQQLRESEEFTVSLLINAPNPILVVNADTSIRFVNPAFERLTGFSANELIGWKAPYPWWIPDTVDRTQREFRQALRHGVNRLEKFFQTRDGDRFCVEITSGLVKSGGEPKYYLSTWTDVTSRKKADEKLRESEERYRRLVDNIAIGVSLISPSM